MAKDMSSMMRGNGDGKENWPAPQWAAVRWKGITRDYTLADVVRLSGSVDIQHTLAQPTAGCQCPSALGLRIKN